MAAEPSPYPCRADRVSPARPARWLLPVLLAGLISCGGDSAGPAAPADPADPGPQPPATGSLQVQATTTGEDVDEDGYLVRVGSEERRIGPNESTTFLDLAVASHTVTLSDVATNCEAEEREKSVAVEADATASVAFSVDCLAVEFSYDVGPGVPPADLATIEEGHTIARRYLERELGGDIPAAVRATITVKVVATGEGNQETGAGGACCTAFAQGTGGESIFRPFYDVLHDNWLNRPGFVSWSNDEDRQASVVHEYAHGWHHALGCISMFDQPLGNWMNEGIAQWVGYQAMIERGAMPPQEVFDFMVFSAEQTGQLAQPLSELEPPPSQPWPGHVGYVALDMLIEGAPTGKLAVRTICEDVAAGASMPDAFEAAFGISLEAFYAQFEEWRQSQL